ncbi:MAG: C40 family peptidase [Candidatus Harrisonbacteria bacterium]|nr:C40 family peptidase [Candidatus Harrisonbacteria bacterium]
MNANQEKIITLARSLIGTPYKYAAKPEDIPQYMDCSSFTQYIYKQIDKGLPRSTLLQAAQAGKKISLTARSSELKAHLETGDLLFFRGSKGHYDDMLFLGKAVYIGHVAIYTGNNKAIHATSPKGVVEESLDQVTKEKGPVAMIKRII